MVVKAAKMLLPYTDNQSAQDESNEPLIPLLGLLLFGHKPGHDYDAEKLCCMLS